MDTKVKHFVPGPIQRPNSPTEISKLTSSTRTPSTGAFFHHPPPVHPPGFERREKSYSHDSKRMEAVELCMRLLEMFFEQERAIADLEERLDNLLMT